MSFFLCAQGKRTAQPAVMAAPKRFDGTNKAQSVKPADQRRWRGYSSSLIRTRTGTGSALSSVVATVRVSIKVKMIISATIIVETPFPRIALRRGSSQWVLYRSHVMYSITKKNNAVHTSLQTRVVVDTTFVAPRWFAKRDSRCYTNRRVSEGCRVGHACGSHLTTRQCFGWIVRTTVSSDRSGTLIMNTM